MKSGFDIDTAMGVQKTFRLYNAAPVLSDRLFSGVNGLEDIDKRFSDLSKQIESFNDEKDVMTAIGLAYNYKIFSHYIRNSPKDIEELIGMFMKETAISLMDRWLNGMGTSFLEQCVQNSELMVPRTLDKVLLERFAPGYASEIDYSDKDALAVILKVGDDKYVSQAFTKGGVSAFMKPEEFKGAMALKIEGIAPLQYKGSVKEIIREYKEYFRKREIKRYSIIVTENEGFAKYLYSRFNLQFYAEGIGYDAIYLKAGESLKMRGNYDANKVMKESEHMLNKHGFTTGLSEDGAGYTLMITEPKKGVMSKVRKKKEQVGRMWLSRDFKIGVLDNMDDDKGNRLMQVLGKTYNGWQIPLITMFNNAAEYNRAVSQNSPPM